MRWVGTGNCSTCSWHIPSLQKRTGGLVVQLPVVSSQHCFTFGIELLCLAAELERGLESSIPKCCPADYWPLATTRLILKIEIKVRCSKLNASVFF